MILLTAWRKLRIACLLGSLFTVAVQAQTFRVTFAFDFNNGAFPRSVVQGRDGNLYGTTYGGGNICDLNGEIVGCGTIFKLNSQGSLVGLYKFGCQDCDVDRSPSTGLTLATDGSFYGITYFGQYSCFTDYCGAIYRITPRGRFATVYSFCAQHNCPDGETPGALIQATDGNIYGITIGGGEYSHGTVFKLTPEANLTTLHSFCDPDDCPEGAAPSSLIEGTDQNLYGTTGGGGHNDGAGTVFKITPEGTLTVLHIFHRVDGDAPYATIEGTGRNLYGLTFLGGAYNNGTVFEITPSGKFSSLYNFCAQPGCADGATPTALTQGNDGNLYGTTVGGGTPTAACPHGCGTVFKLTPQSSLTTLHNFELTDGLEPQGGLFQATNGILYGAAGTGFNRHCKYLYSGCGEIFSLDVGLGPFVALVRESGRVGQTGGILGQGFTGTTSVMLNGTPASFKVVSDTYLTATVPPGATSGYVTVTTPSGMLKSNKPFHVIP